MTIDWFIILAILFVVFSGIAHRKTSTYDPAEHLGQSVGHALASITEPVGLFLYGLLAWAIFNHDLVGAALIRIVR